MLGNGPAFEMTTRKTWKKRAFVQGAGRASACVRAAGLLAVAAAAIGGAAPRSSADGGPLWLPIPARMSTAKVAAKPLASGDLGVAVTRAARAWGLNARTELRVHVARSSGPPTAIYNLGATGVMAPAGNAGGTAQRFLTAFAPVYGLSEADMAGVVLEERPGLAGGREVVVTEAVAGRRLYGARLRVHFASDGAFVAAAGTLYGGLRWEEGERISQDEAWSRARAFAAKLTGADAGDADGEGEIGAIQEAAYPLGDVARPAWVVTAVAAPNGVDRFEMVVDAVDGRILEVAPLTWYDGPRGQVFTAASPQPSLTPGTVPPVPNPPPYAARSVVPFAGDAVMNPSGWVLAGSTLLAGNNAYVRKYPGPNFSPLYGIDISAPSANFQFPLQLGPFQPDVRNYGDAAGTNLFYLVNVAHDYFYSLGFDEAHGNFQSNNFGRGGKEGDSLLAFTQLKAGTPGSTPYESSNAWMYTPADGSNPSMGMYVWGPHPGGYYTDSSLDSEVVLHEYAHGVTARLGTGFWGAQGGAINEGTSDLLALNFLLGASAPADGSFPVAAYASQAFVAGARTYPYSTRTDVNPLTYDSFGHITDDGPEIHRDGEIWAVTMWEVRAALIGRHGYSEGRTRTAQLLVDALQLAPDFPSMIAMRDALLAAERNRYGGADEDALWQAFAKRGMGFMAAGASALSVHVHADGGVPTAAAQLRLWESDLYLGEAVRLLVGDTNATTAPPVTLTISNGDSETVTLAQDGAVYSGAIASGSGRPAPGNGSLELAPGATLTATTADGNPGAGIPSLSDTALVHAPYAISQGGNLFDAGLATTRLGEGDDTLWRHALPFPFVFFGVEYTTVWVSSNGLLTFGGGVSGWYESVDQPGALPFIAPFACDLVTEDGAVQPNEGVYYYDGGDRFTVLWRAQKYGTSPRPINTAVSLFPDGTIRFDYGPGNELRDNTQYGPHHATVGVGRGSDTFSQAVSGYDGAPELGNAPSVLFLPVSLGTPEVSVLEGEHAVYDAQPAAVFFGGPAVGGAASTRVFTVHNEGYATLALGAVTVPDGFTVTEGLAASLSPGASDTFTVRMETGIAGTKSGEVSFATGDADENPFNFPVTGTVVPSALAWDIQDSGTRNRLVDVDFPSENEGWAAAQPGLLHTVDGGTTWVMTFSDRWFNAVRFRDAQNGAAIVGDIGFAHTTDAGRTWSGYSPDWSDVSQYSDVFPVSPDVVWLTAAWGGPVDRWTYCPGCGYRGSDWRRDSFSPVAFRDLSAIYFTDPDTGWLAGAAGTIIRITNASSGQPTFTAQTAGTGAYLHDIQMLDATTGWAVGQGGTILHTGNGGTTWTPQDSRTSTDLLAVDFADAYRGLVAGQRGLILATSDGGATWVPQADVVSVDLRGVALPSPESGFAVGGDGTILRRSPAAALPEITVLEGEAAVKDGQAIPVHFGSAAQAAAGRTRTFTVRNDGGVALTLGVPSVPAGFTLTEGLAAGLVPGASDTFTVRLDTAATGTTSGSVSFSTNDTSENPFSFPVAGSVLPAGTLTPCAADVPRTLPNDGAISSTLSVAGATTLTTDVNVRVTLAHPYYYSLSAHLIGPTGIRVQLFSRDASDGFDFIDAAFDDEAGTSTPASSEPLTGSVRPLVSLATLDDSSPNGTWTLEVTSSANTAGGSLVSWCLEVTTAAEAAAEIVVLDGTTSIANGQPAGIWFGSVPHGAAAPTRSFTVRNDGVAALTLGPVSVPDGFTVTEGLASSLAPGAWDSFTVRLESATVGWNSGQVSFPTNDPNENPFSFAIMGTVDAVPEIAVQEGANAIADGQVTPVGFGDVATGGPAPTRTFTVRNNGAGRLTLGALSVPAGFAVTDTLAASIAPGGSDTFAIQMGTSAPGPKGGEVRFASNDPDNDPFTFPISGMVTGPPEVTLTEGATSITDGQTTPVNIGSVAQGTAGASRTFTVRNDGGAALSLGAVNVPAGFTLTEGLVSTLAAGASDTFTVQLQTTSVGTSSGEVSFANDDSDENPFNFPVAGHVLAPGTLHPCATDVPVAIVDSRTVTSPLFISGAATGIADVNVTLTITYPQDSYLNVFLIGPTGIRVELFTGVGSYGANFVNTVLDDEAATAITSGTAPFTGSFRPAGSLSALDGGSPNGTWTLEIANKGYPAGALVSWCLTVATAAEALPEITVRDSTASIFNGQVSPVNLGFGAQGTVGPTRAFTVRNDGTAPMTLGVVGAPAGFTVAEGLASSLAPGASDTFTIQLDTTLVGTRNGVLTIASNDPDESPFTFPIAGTVLPPSALVPCAAAVPVALADEGTVSSSLIISGAATGIADVNITLTITYPQASSLGVYLVGPTGIRVELFDYLFGASGPDFVNTVLDDEAATGITSGVAPFTGSFRPVGSLAALDDISPNGTWTLEVTKHGSLYTGSLVSWCLAVTTAAEALPELTVREGTAPVADGQTTPVSFGFAAQGAAGPTRTFTVRNDGTAPLSLGAVNVPAGFTVTEGLTSNLAPGASDTFTVRLDTATVGARNGVLTFSSNDANESPFNFPVTGAVTTLAPCAGDVPKVIPYNGATTSALTIAGASTGITDVNVLLTITHPNDPDLRAALIGPTGIRVELFTHVASYGADFVDTVLDDEAAAAITAGTPPFTGSFRPKTPLSALDDVSPNGTWTLEVWGSSPGVLESWCLAVTTAAQALPEITVREGTAPMVDGQTTPVSFGFGAQDDAGPTRVFTVRNDGTAPLTLGSVTVPAGFSVTEGLTSSLAPGASDTFTVQLETATVGTKEGVLTFANNDPDENPFNVPLAGVVSTYVPCAHDEHTAIPGGGTVTSTASIAGATTGITDVNVLLTITHPYDQFLDVCLIGPTGTRVKLLTGDDIYGQNFVNTLLDDEAAAAISSGTAPFTGSFRPDGSLAALDGSSPNGTWTLEVKNSSGYYGSIESWCLSVTTAAPEITVFDGIVEIADGQTVAIDLGSTGAGSTGPIRSFTVRNAGDATLTVGTLTAPAGFTVIEGLSATLPPGASDTFTVRLDTRTTGNKWGKISISNNDSDENPFTFAITGAVRGRPRQHL